MTVAIYVRVSTQRQAQAQTIEQQLDRLRAHLRKQSVELASEGIVRDDGATLNRPGLDRLRDAVRLGQIDRLLVTDPDRLARNYVQLMVLLEELERAGCEVVFLDRPISRDPQDQLLLQIRGAVAEYERTLIAERMRRGRQMKLRAGCLLPWTRAPYGYRLDPDHPRDPAGISVEPAEAAVVQELFARYLEDRVSLLGLARHLQALGIASPSGQQRWSTATLRGILINPLYAGQIYAGRWRSRAPRCRRSATHPIGKPADSSVPVPAAQWLPVASIPALVSQEQFAHVQAKLAQNRAFARRHNTRHAYLLRALVSCGVCRSSCICRTVHQRYDYYVCLGKEDPLRSHRDELCPARYAPAHQLDALVWQDLCALLTQPEQIAQALARVHGGGWLPQELQARREQLRQGQRGLERQLERLTEAYLLAVIPLAEYQRRRQVLEQRQQALVLQADQLEAQADRQAALAGWAASAAGFCRRVQAGLAGADFAQKRQLVELLVDRVLVSDGEVEIRYVLPLSPASEKVRLCHLRKDYFDLPMAAYRPGEGPGIKLGRAEKVTSLAGGLAAALGSALDHADHGQARERHLARVAPIREQPGHIVADGVAADLDAAVVAVGRLPAVERTRRRIGEEGFHVLEGGRAVRLQRQEIIAAARQDGLGDLALGADGIDRDQSTFQGKTLQEERDGGDLVRLAGDRLLPEHQALTAGPSRDEMERLAALAAGVAAAGGLAINGDQVRRRLAQALNPARKAGLE